MSATTIGGRFAAISTACPETIAIQIGGRSWTYNELARSIAQTVEFLAEEGIGPEDRVGLALPRGVEAIVAMLAVTTLGAAFVPLPLDWPSARVEFVLDDARPSLVLAAAEALPVHGSARWRVFPTFDPHRDAGSAPPALGDPRSLACVLYTSGSTGRPKGVCLEQGAILARLGWAWQTWPWAREDRSLHRSSLGFIDAITESLAPLLCGAGLVILPQADSADMVGMLALIRRERLTRVTLVPSLLRELLELCPDLAQLPPRSVWVVSGERLERPLLARLREAAPELTVLNLYGCTEVAGDATGAVFEPGAALPPGPVAIGRAIAGARVHILDPQGGEVEPGALGEIHVGGPILARGYHRPEDERGRFVDGGARGRLFRTGDLGRCQDGELHYAGRVDHQVKLRGVRIELEEVEAVLAEVLAGQVAVVVASQPLRLVAFTTDASVDSGQVLAHAGQRLPPAAVPAEIRVLDELPRTPSGKRDRPALLAGCVDRGGSAPTLPLERELALMMARSLDCAQVDREHSLATRGGDSLATAAFTTRIRERFGWRELESGWLKMQSVAALAEHFGSNAASDRRGSDGAPSSRWAVQAVTLAEGDALVDFSTAVFVAREPLSRRSGLRAQDFAPYARAVIDQSLSEGMAWSARAPETGECVGFCLAHDFTARLDYTPCSAMAPTFALLGQLIGRYKALRGRIRPGEVAEIAMTGAQAGVDGFDVAQALETCALEAFARGGFSRVITICTHPATADLAEQLGFVERGGVCYRDFIWGGERLFADGGASDGRAILYEYGPDR